MFSAFTPVFGSTLVPPPEPLSGVVQGNGSIVVLKAFTIPGVFYDGTAFYNRMMTYRQSGGNGMICDVTYLTAKSDGSSPVSIPGQDAVFTVGEQVDYLSDSAYGERFTERTLDNGRVLQDLNLRFSSLGSSQLMNVSCNVTTDPEVIVTVADFEEATGGLFTLRVKP
jgi:hypothetical protein